MPSKVNVILMTHEEIGLALMHTATTVLGKLPLPTKVITVCYNADPEKIITKLKNFISRIDSDTSFLVLTDLYGATPSNIAAKVQKTYVKNQISIVTGLNLPMLIRVMNYANLGLECLTEKAVSGGKDGVRLC
jgi:mannose PTS system EIIA component